MKKVNLLKLVSMLLAVIISSFIFSACDNNSATGSSAPTATTEPESSYIPVTEAIDSYKEYVKLGEYKNISIVKDVEVTEDEIFSEYVEMLSEQDFTGVTDRAVKEGDAVSIDYCGYLDGVKFAGGEASDYTLIIGSGTFIPGFEDACIGIMPGKDFDINVTFPENYGQSDLAGKAVVFKSKINLIFPELSDETANIATEGEYTTAESLYNFIKDGLYEAEESEWENNKADMAVETVYNNSEILKYPDGAIETYIEKLEESYRNQGIDNVAAYVGLSQEEYEKQVTEMAETEMGMRLVCFRIAEIEKIEVTDDELTEFTTGNYAVYGFSSAEKFIEYYTEEYIKETLLMEEVSTYLLGNVTIEDVSAETVN